MIPINFDGANMPFKKPDSMTEGECLDLIAEVGFTDKKYPYILTAWQPSDADVEAIKSGKPIFIRMLTMQLAPMSVFTRDDNNDVNE